MIVLVLGGARSGKSAAAEAIAAELGQPVTYLATVMDDGSDPDLTARVAAHQARRPASWTTVQADRRLDEHVARPRSARRRLQRARLGDLAAGRRAD